MVMESEEGRQRRRRRRTHNLNNLYRRMMRFQGNGVAKNFRLGRSQYRQCSSMTEKGVPMGDAELFIDNMAGLFYKGAFVAVGFVLGGLASSGVSEEVRKDEEAIIRAEQYNDERELNTERMRKDQLELRKKAAGNGSQIS